MAGSRSRTVARSLLAALVLVLSGCAQQPIHRQHWIGVRTTHFEIWSTLDEEETFELAKQVELFRSAVEFAAGRKIPPARIKTRVLAFDERGFSRPFMLHGDKGYFLSTLQGPILVLRGGKGWTGDASVLQRRAFAAYLMREAGRRDRLWLETGLAEFAGNVEIRGRGALVGRPRRDHAAALRDRTARSFEDTLLAIHTADAGKVRLEVFRSQAWGLVHYGRIGFARLERVAPIDRIVRQYALGTPDQRAISLAFGTDPEGLAHLVNEYVRQEDLGRVIVRHDPGKVLGTERFDAAHGRALGQLADLAVALSHSELALRFYRYALILEPEVMRWQAGRAVARALAGDYEAAATELDVALARAPADAWVQLAAGRVAQEEAQVTGGQEALDLVVRARSHYEQSLLLEPENPETLARLAATYAVGVDAPERGLQALSAARAMLPASLEVDLIDATLLLRLSESAQARALLRDVISRTATDDTMARARALLAEIDGS